MGIRLRIDLLTVIKNTTVKKKKKKKRQRMFRLIYYSRISFNEKTNGKAIVWIHNIIWVSFSSLARAGNRLDSYHLLAASNAELEFPVSYTRTTFPGKPSLPHSTASLAVPCAW